MVIPEKTDLHIHTTVSDGTDRPQEIVGLVSGAGIGLFSVTDHDSVKASVIIRGLLKKGDPAFLTGAEFSCRDDGGKYHILGYGYDPDAEAMRAFAGKAHGMRMRKVERRLNALEAEFGVSFPREEVDRLLKMDNPGKPHIGNLMVKYGYSESKDSAIKDRLNRLHIKSEYLRPDETIEAIRESGGIPVLAHPAYGSGDQLILGDELEERVEHLISFGLEGLEACYSGLPEKLRRSTIALADRHGLFVTAGSDYHGSNKLVVLGDTGLDEEPEVPEGFRRFLEAVRDKIMTGTDE